MFDIGWVEMMVIVIVLVVIIGPKDLPRVLHGFGQWVGRARAMARQFQDGIAVMAKDTGVDEVREGMRTIRDFRFEDEIERNIDPDGELRAGIAGKPSENEGGTPGSQAPGPGNSIAGPAAPTQPSPPSSLSSPSSKNAKPDHAVRKGRTARAHAGRGRQAPRPPLTPANRTRPRGGPQR